MYAPYCGIRVRFYGEYAKFQHQAHYFTALKSLVKLTRRFTSHAVMCL
jgi:hypothetical protein